MTRLTVSGSCGVREEKSAGAMDADGRTGCIADVGMIGVLDAQALQMSGT